jgi:hypothetical protein
MIIETEKGRAVDIQIRIFGQRGRTHPYASPKRGLGEMELKRYDKIYKLLNSSIVSPAWRINLVRMPGPSSLCWGIDNVH